MQQATGMHFKMEFLLLTIFCSVGVFASAPGRNILFLLEDDGSMDLGFYGNKNIQTPNLDALAKTGTIFTSAFTHVSSCSPSRSALLSGLPSHQNGMYGLQNSVQHFSAFDHVKSIPNILNEAGYVTGIIGKFHVWPATDFNFSWGNNPEGPGGCQTGLSDACPNTDFNFVTRNITHMKEQAEAFIDYAEARGKPWMLYVGFGDSHRCGGAVGEFCELYGWDKATSRSTIPDWRPIFYRPEEVAVPYWIQDTPVARSDLAKMYTAKNRMDQGVGLLQSLLRARAARAASTLVIYLADNGAPFAAGKTNFYQPGSVEPLVVAVPGSAAGQSDELVTSLDMLPTILDWAHVPLPSYVLNGVEVRYTGRSLLPVVRSAPAQPASYTHPLLQTLTSMQNTMPSKSQLEAFGDAPPPPLPANFSRVFHSFQLHEIQMYYPMRAVHARADASTTYHLIYNIAHFLPYPIASDLWLAPAMQDLVERTQRGEETNWYRNFSNYLFTPREKYELFDLRNDPMELMNVANDPAYANVLQTLLTEIKAYQFATNDDWTSKYIHE
jgi:N-sulfoglucosamine sulfohydrolase